VDVDVLCAPSHDLMQRLEAGDLDLALISGGHAPAEWPARELWRGKLRWVTSDQYAPHRQDPLPVALAADHCTWRRAAIDALRAAGRRYRVAYTSATLAGTYAPVIAGLAVTVSAITFLPPGLRALPDDALPPLPETSVLLMMAREPRQPVTDVLAGHLADIFVGGRE
jgi:DNA-binding transcriptional LysR family regulator